MSNYFGLSLVVDNTNTAVTLSQAKAHLSVEQQFTDDDAYISALLLAAQRYCEDVTQRCFFNKTFLYTLDYFPYFAPYQTYPINDRYNLYATYWRRFCIKLPWPRAQSITSVVYTDMNQQQQTMDSSLYFLDNNSEPGRLAPIYGQYWPYQGMYLPGTVQITFVAGSYGDGVETNNVPMPIQQAILLLVGYWYANRAVQGTAPPKEMDFTVDALLDTYKFYTFSLVD